MGKYLKLFNTHSLYNDYLTSDNFIKPNVSHCIQENEMHYNPLPDTNGHYYANLGLPSGTLWAKMNVGAESESDYGLLFAWGETQGYTREQLPSAKNFWWEDYKYSYGNTTSNKVLIKYCYDSTYGYEGFSDNLTTLDLEDDAAHINWGGDWTMPTIEQYQELKDNTTFIWTSKDGINGIELTSIHNGVKIFLPANGFYKRGAIGEVGTMGHYWTNEISVTANPDFSLDIGVKNTGLVSDPDSRCVGRGIRAVCNNID